MSKKRAKRIGKLPPRYSFALNKYKDAHFSKCPICGRRTNKRKFPLFVHVDGWEPLALGKTCCYCPRCELIITHQDEIEEQLLHFFTEHCPDLVGNEYIVLGTVRMKAWKEGLNGKKSSLKEMLKHVSAFKKVVALRVDYEGWFPVGRVPERMREGA